MPLPTCCSLAISRGDRGIHPAERRLIPVASDVPIRPKGHTVLRLSSCPMWTRDNLALTLPPASGSSDSRRLVAPHADELTTVGLIR